MIRQPWCIVALLLVVAGLGHAATNSGTAAKSSDASPPDVVASGTRIHVEKDSIYAIRDNPKISIEHQNVRTPVKFSYS